MGKMFQKFLLMAALVAAPLCGSMQAQAGNDPVVAIGWGYTNPDGNSFTCPLTTVDGKTGTATFGTDGSFKIVLGNDRLVGTAGLTGLVGEMEIDDDAHDAFPELDKALRILEKKGYSANQLKLETFRADYKDGENMNVRNHAMSSFLDSCVFIVDKATGMPVFCLHCIYIMI